MSHAMRKGILGSNVDSRGPEIKLHMDHQSLGCLSIYSTVCTDPVSRH